MLLPFTRSKKIRSWWLRFFVWLDNIAYKGITKVAIIDNQGVHPKHQILNYHQFFVDQVQNQDRVIDIGCGKGENAYDVAAKAKQVVGIDIEQKNVDKAKNNYQRPNLEYICGDATTYNFSSKFNKIILSNVLEHIEHRVEFLKKLHHISDTILLRVPMIDRDWVAVYKKQKGLEYRLDPTHFIEYTLPILKEELQQGGWKIESYSIQFGEFWGVVKSTSI
jgi:SAM-dependent methyltransferase